MPDSFSRTPKIQKGAFAVYESSQAGKPPTLIIFQFNPDALRRTLADRAVEAPKGNVGAAKEDALRVQGPPIETINLTLDLDATDQLGQGVPDAVVAEHGLHPALAKLELLMYPAAMKAQEIEDMAQQGKVEINPADLPLVLLVWGKSRVLPVDITSFSIAEEAFDINLNPIRAKVDLGLKVLTYMELDGKNLGRDAFITYQKRKEELAGMYGSGFEEKGVRDLLPSGKTT